jgi:glycerate 2-kinase
MNSKQLVEALNISSLWLSEFQIDELLQRQLSATGLLDHHSMIDVVSIGKASRTMAKSVRSILGPRIARQIVMSNYESDTTFNELEEQLVIGDHPVPGTKSLAAGAQLLKFLAGSTASDVTLFLISGGASSICVLPEAPVTLDDLAEIWTAALEAGIHITTLNQLRAATSAIAGGAVLRSVRTPKCQALIMVDNVMSGPRWVASGLTYAYQPLRGEVVKLVELINRSESVLEEKILEAFERRSLVMTQPVATDVDNAVVAEPAMMLECARARAQELGYRIIDMGARIHGDVADVVDEWNRTISQELAHGGAICVIGVGEVTVQVRGSGRGGRCQEFAWRMASVLNDLDRPGVFVARASDGRDYLTGVAGAWVDQSTVNRATLRGFDWTEIVTRNDSFRALDGLGQIIEGGPTGWNLCDLYVALV